MKQDYDFIADSLLFYINEDYKYKRSIRFNEDIILDFNDKDVPVALELLNASKTFNVKKHFLKQPVGIKMDIFVGEDVIKLIAKFPISIHQKEIPTKPLVEEKANTINLIANEAHFDSATA
jgi:uncharacterized protein YuzE